MELEDRTLQEGISLNQYIVYAVTYQVSSAYNIQVVPNEHPREQRKRYQTLLDKPGTATEDKNKRALDAREEVEPEADLVPDVID